MQPRAILFLVKVVFKMPKHRLVHGNKLQIISAKQPFSSFEFIENKFKDFSSLRRLFSIARSHQFKTLSLENIPEKGIIAEENEDISQVFTSYEMKGLYRLAFWNTSFNNKNKIEELSDKNLIGYAILKCDYTKENGESWHIFESVFKKKSHKHNCISSLRNYKVYIDNNEFAVEGVMYCQQNDLNKACAQVALRSLLSDLPSVGCLSYRKINELAKKIISSNEEKGLSVVQIRNVLQKLNISFRDIDYSEGETKGGYNPMRNSLPYRKFVYSGVESGLGALLGFHLAEPGLTDEEQDRHIIPFFGHTFNKDTWVPDASLNYFEIGSDICYISSDNWTSSFIGHDDNFGSDFCIPKIYIKKSQVDYVVEILKPNVMYSGVQAEAMSLLFLYSLLPLIDSNENSWISRLYNWSQPEIKKIVFRAISLTKEEYISHLNSIKDWDKNTEKTQITNILKERLPTHLWIVEISIPHLFPANERKLGEIVLDASRVPTETKTAIDYTLFVMARLPGVYYLKDINDDEFLEIESAIKTHVELIKQNSVGLLDPQYQRSIKMENK